MRYWVCLSVLLLAACSNGDDTEQVRRSDLRAVLASESHRVDRKSAPSYEIDPSSIKVSAVGSKTFTVVAPYHLSAFGGEIMGDDRAQAGGELMFRDQRGDLQELLGSRNVRGIFQMPFGVVVFVSSVGGELYLVAPSHPGPPKATGFGLLAGSPSEVVRAVSGNIVFKINTGRHELRNGYLDLIFDCYRLTQAGAIEPLSCESIKVID